MNVFLLDPDPGICATYHCDKHVVKMVLESAQILCSALWKLEVFNDRCCEKLGGKWFYFPECGAEHLIYGATHLNHPLVDWATDLRNWVYLRRLGRALALEYRYRYEKDHASLEVINHLPIPEMKVHDPSYFHLAIPTEPHIMDTVFSWGDAIHIYRRYYKTKQNKFNMNWTKREVPSWFTSKE